MYLYSGSVGDACGEFACLVVKTDRFGGSQVDFGCTQLYACFCALFHMFNPAFTSLMFKNYADYYIEISFFMYH